MFVVMDPLVRIYESDLSAKRSLIAILFSVHAFDLSCPNQMTADENAHALRLGSILARQKKTVK